MEIEYETTFLDVDKEGIRNRLERAGAKLVRPEFSQKRVVFNFPKGHKIKDGWVRLRDEGDKITLTLKIVSGDIIEGQKEIGLIVNDFEKTREFLKTIGCHERSYQENKRELWQMDKTEVTIDEWPFLKPYVEIEGDSEESVKAVAEKLGFDYQDALFCSTDMIYNKKYNLPEGVFNQVPKIVFGMKNPFI